MGKLIKWGRKGRSQRILIVDANPAIFMDVGPSLLEAGYVLCGVAAGFDALAELKQFRPDVVLIDLFLSDLPGLQVALAVQAVRPRCKVIFLSPLPSQDVVTTSWAGATYSYGVLTRPVSPPELFLHLE